MIYMDYSATTPLSIEVKEHMIETMNNHFGNPSSMHKLGVLSEKLIKSARQTIAKGLRVQADEVYFTSGGTEANNIAIQGICKRNKLRKKHIVTTAFEHPSVRSTFKILEEEGYQVTFVPILESGAVAIGDLVSSVGEDTLLVSIMHVNNEIGTIQDLEKISKAIKLKNKDTLIHVDAVQSFGKFPINLKRLPVDCMTISSHKIYGPKGVGGLYVKKGTPIDPLVIGGQQEKALRPGTENLVGISGFGMAAKISLETLKDNLEKVTLLKSQFLNELSKSDISYKITGTQDLMSPYILNVSFDRMRGEVLLHTLESEGVFVSTGSACSSKKKEYSHVLSALGYSDERMEGAIRFSFSPLMTEKDISDAANKVIKSVIMLDNIIRGR